MIYLIWLLPLLVALVTYVIFRNALAIKVGAFGIAITIIYSLSHVAIAKHGMMQDTEWWGNYAVSVHYYDDWDEEVHCRHSYKCNCYTTTDKDGHSHEHCSTCYYHAYDVDYHAEHWSMRYDNGEEHRITKYEYDKYCKMWGDKKYKIELNRDYHSNDGDDMACNWNLVPNTCESITTEHTYENRVQASNSIFKASHVDTTEVRQYKLYNYPTCSNGYQQVVLGYNGHIDDETIRLLKYINGYYGSKKQFKLFVCCYYNQAELVAERQHSYWDNLNKNEFLVCVGLNKNNEIQWAKSFSWMDKPMLSAQADQYLRATKTFSPKEFAKWLPANIENHWHRKHFRDFNYLQVDITQSQYTAIFIVILLMCIAQALVTKSVIDNENDIYR